MQNVCRVLVVEDEYIMRQGIKHLLNWGDEGFEIVGEANNGREGLALAEKLHPHIVLTDVVMPGMDGIELTTALHHRWPQIQVIVLSGYSDFAYVRGTFQNGAVDYVLKPTLNPADLLKTMKRAAGRIPGMSLQSGREASLSWGIGQLLLGFETEDCMQLVRRAFPADCFCLFGMNVARVCGPGHEELQKQGDLLARSASEFLKDIPFVQLDAEDAMLMLLLNFAQGEYARTVVALRHMAEAMAHSEPRVFYVTSEPFAGIERLRDVYRGGFQQNTERAFYYKGRPFMAAEDFRGAPQPPRFDDARFGQYVETMQFDKAFSQLRDCVEESLSLHALDELELKTLVQNSFLRVFSALEDRGLNADNLAYLKRDSLTKIQAVHYADEFSRAFHIILEDLEAILKKYDVCSQNATMQQILQYIDSHFAQTLSLKELAAHFNFNYYYLSTYFHTHHQEGFIEYLNRKRVQRAAELLQGSRLSVSEICRQVGYGDQSYFSKVFKRTMQCTPREYRRRGKGNGEEVK